jgi:hypothetical protein
MCGGPRGYADLSCEDLRRRIAYTASRVTAALQTTRLGIDEQRQRRTMRKMVLAFPISS